jgi:hypothetical protein
MQIMISGSIGYGGFEEIGRLYSFLLKEDFGIVDHLVSKGADYSDIKDFRDKKELSHQIVNHDLEYVEKLMFWLYYQIGQVMCSHRDVYCQKFWKESCTVRKGSRASTVASKFR